MDVLATVMLLVIRVYDACGIDPASLLAARRLAADTLAGAGVEISWIVCGAGESDRRCVELPKPSDLLVRIITTHPSAANGLLGFAYLDSATRSGSLATLYIDRIKRVADAGMIDEGTLLGRALAHETGHLLLGSNAHSTRGLMRATWTATEFRRRMPGDWRFSPTEAAQMREGALRRSVIAQAPLQAAGPDPVQSPPAPWDQPALQDGYEGAVGSWVGWPESATVEPTR